MPEFNPEKDNTSHPPLPDWTELEIAVHQWHEQRGLFEVDVNAQMTALTEEFGELAHAIGKGTREDRIDAIGDMLVVLTNIAHREMFTLRHCYEHAYNEIKSRTGKVTNGRYVKDPS